MSEEVESEDFRFERKYFLDGVAPAEIRMWVRLCPLVFRTAFPPRHINNIYLDSPRLDCFHDNLHGIADRTKVRVRWYGPLFGFVRRPVLEFKIKRGMVGTKQSFHLPPFQLGPGFGHAHMRRVFGAADLPGRVRSALEGVELSVMNRYHRTYHVSANRQYRITIDSGLEFHRILARANRFTVRRRLLGAAVMELKYSGKISEMDERIMNYFPFRVTRMSKYVVGVTSVAP